MFEHIRKMTASVPVIIAALAFAAAGNVNADRPMTMKVATVAPKGSIYHRVLQEVGEAWRDAQGSGSRFIVYPDSAQGNEATTVRRMRVGQLSASMLSVVGLSEIDDSVAVLQKIPLMFHSWEELDFVRESLRSDLEARLREKGFVVLFWGEGGWVHFFSKTPRTTPADFRSSRIFAWAGDVAQVELMKSLGYNPIVLELSDILPALQTGMIDTVPAAPLWGLVGQFDRAAPHMLQVNWVPIVGATVMTTRAWESMSAPAREALAAASARAGEQLRAHRDAHDTDVILAMQARGLNVHRPTPDEQRQWDSLARGVWPQVRGSMVRADMFDRVVKLLAEFRGTEQ